MVEVAARPVRRHSLGDELSQMFGGGGDDGSAWCGHIAILPWEGRLAWYNRYDDFFVWTEPLRFEVGPRFVAPLSR